MAQEMGVADIPNVKAEQMDVFKTLAGSSDDTGSIKQVRYFSRNNSL